MLVWALVRLASVVVTAAHADVMLVAKLDLLEALYFVSIVFEGIVQSLPDSVASDVAGWLRFGLWSADSHVCERKVWPMMSVVCTDCNNWEADAHLLLPPPNQPNSHAQQTLSHSLS